MDDAAQTQLRAWYVIGNVIGTFDFSVGPNNAWGAELTEVRVPRRSLCVRTVTHALQRSSERVRLYGWSNFFSFVGNIAGTALPPLLVHTMASSAGDAATRVAYEWFGWAVTVTYAVTMAAMLLWLPERQHASAVHDASRSPVRPRALAFPAWESAVPHGRRCPLSSRRARMCSTSGMAPADDGGL